MVARPREAHVKRELRHCDIHGLAEFAERVMATHKTMLCMQCQNIRVKKYQQEVRDGLRVPTKRGPQKGPTVAPPCCPKHFTALTPSGACGECE